MLYNKKYFKVFVDWKNKSLNLEVYTKDNHLLLSNPCWNFKILDNLLKLKSNSLILVNFLSKKEEKTLYYWFNQAIFYEELDSYKFLKCIESGLITVKFKVLKDKESTISFTILTSNLDKIYNSIFKE